MTSPISIDLDCAKVLLQTYQQVNDTSYAQSKNIKASPKMALKNPKIKTKGKDIEVELQILQEKYQQLLQELNSKEEMVARLNRQLTDRTSDLARLQEDFEHAIYQFNNKLIQNASNVPVFK